MTTLAQELPVLDHANDNHVITGRPKVVGLMGYGGVGKSEVAKILEEQYGFERPHIKQPLRDMAAVLVRACGFSDHEVDRYLDGDLKRDPIPGLGGRSGTEIQQFLGTEFGREFIDPDLWLSLWCRKIDGHLSRGAKGVVSESVRFKNEATAIRVRGGIIVLIERDGYGPINDHKSESFPVDPDVVIDNSYDIPTLAKQVSVFMKG